ncbi:MAG: hypothetical protein QM758_28245 [Armatimonas sp.]
MREATFALEGAIERPGPWGRERLLRELASEIRSVDYVVKGERRNASAVPLLSLIQAARPKLNPRAKNHLLAFSVFVRANDGYTMSFSLGEMSPTEGKRAVWVAFERSGKPILGDDGPVEILVPDDSRPARFVHGVSRIIVVDGLALTDPKNRKVPGIG